MWIQRVGKMSKRTIDDENMMAKIIQYLTEIKRTSEVTSDQVLGWTSWVEVWRVHKALLDTTKEN